MATKKTLTPYQRTKLRAEREELYCEAEQCEWEAEEITRKLDEDTAIKKRKRKPLKHKDL